MSALDRVLARLEGVTPRGDREAMACCPAHEDRTPSLSVKEDRTGKVLLHCFGCHADAETIASAAGLELQDLFPDTDRRARNTGYRVAAPHSGGAEPRQSGASVAALARHFALSEDWLRGEVGLTDSPGGRVMIPVRGESGDVLHRRVRAAMSGRGKYRYEEKGTTPAPYGLDRLAEFRGRSRPSLILVEGESDCWTLWHHGMPALGLPGSSTAKLLEAHHLEGFEHGIYAVQEPDQGGEQFVAGVAKRMADLRVTTPLRVISGLPGGAKDPAELHRRDPANFPAAFRSAAASAAERGGPDVGQLLITLSDIPRREVEWTWRPYIPSGTLTMIGGQQGAGKGVLIAGLVAHVTAGRRLPVEAAPRTPANVLLFTAEDDFSRVLRPRVEDGGGDLSRVQVFDHRRHTFRLEDQYFSRLRAMIEYVRPSMVVMDPIASWTGDRMDINKQNAVQGALEPLLFLAEETGTAIVGVMHRRKGEEGGALDHFMASVAFTSVPRSALIVAEDPDDVEARLLAQAKCNLDAGTAPTLRYRADRGVLEWDGESPLTADEIARPVRLTPDERNEMDEAVDWLEAELSEGEGLWLKARTIKRAARSMQIQARSLMRAKHALRIRTRRHLGEWEWSLPEEGGGEGAPV